MAIENIVDIDINEVKIKKRVRSKTASYDSLVTSIKEHGLLEPIVIDQKKRLVAGMRRLEACKALGHKTILARVVEVDSDEAFLLLEMEENICRVPFTEEEILKGKQRLDGIRHPNFFQWLWRKIKRLFTVK